MDAAAKRTSGLYHGILSKMLARGRHQLVWIQPSLLGPISQIVSDWLGGRRRRRRRRRW
jgi:hypothetical protein